LGFAVFGGNIDQNWLIMKNGSTVIGLFQGMFDKNMMTFNPGWDQNADEIDEFDDIRKIYQHLKLNEMEITPLMDENNEGPAYFTVSDPDGNQILFDQHR